MIALRSNPYSHSAGSLPSGYSPYHDGEKELNPQLVNWLCALKNCSISASPESWGGLRDLYERAPEVSKDVQCDELTVLFELLEEVAKNDFAFDASLQTFAEKAYQAVCSSGGGYDPSFWAERDPTPQRASPCTKVWS